MSCRLTENLKRGASPPLACWQTYCCDELTGEASRIRNVDPSHKIRRSFRGKMRPKEIDRSDLEPPHHLSGTEGSNPTLGSSGFLRKTRDSSIQGEQTNAFCPRFCPRRKA